MINKDLAAFIIEQRAQGITDADISTALVGRGWNQADVSAALALSTVALMTPVAGLPGAGALLSEALAFYRKRFMLFFLIFLPPTVVSIVMGFIAPPALPVSEVAPVFQSGLFIGLIVGTIISGFLYLVSSIATILVLKDETITSPLVAWERALPLLPRYFMTSLNVGVWVAVGFILIIPGIILLVQYSFATLISIVEGKKVTEALSQSKAYVKGRWGAIASRLFAGTLVVILANMLLGLVITPLVFVQGAAPVAKAISSLTSAVFSGFLSVYMYILYLRVKGS